MIPRCRRAAVLLVVLAALGTPVAAVAQSSTTPPLPTAGQTLSTAPPVSLGTSSTATTPAPAPSATSTSATASSSTATTPALRTLPRTGFDLGELAAVGAVLLAAGIGLRLRTRDVRWPKA